MKNTIVGFVCVLSVLLAGCASTPPVGNLVSLDEAISGAATLVEDRTQSDTKIVLAEIVSPLPALSDFLDGELDSRFNFTGKLTVLARGQSLEQVNAEQDFQMSGLVSDKSAVGIGHYLGAEVVVTGDFNRFANFSQIYIRAIDVETAQVLATYSAKIDNNDPVLVGITAPLGSAKGSDMSEEALDHLNLGKDYYAADIPDIAIEEFGKALAINSKLSEAYIYRGTAYSDKGDYGRAIADFTAALRINPNMSTALYNRGNAYFHKNNYDRAIADYTAALRIDPDYIDALYNRGNVYFRKNNYDRAIVDYTAALRIDPNRAIALNNRGVAYSGKGDYDRAIADYTAALRIDPSYVGALSNRGVAYSDKGDYDRAIADYTAALRIDPDDAITLFNRGTTYARKGNDDRAIADYTVALRVDPDYAYALFNRGVAYCNKGDYNRAIKDYEAGLRIEPNRADAREYLELARRARGY